MRYLIKGPESVIQMLIVFPGQRLLLTDASGTTFKLGHTPGIYFNFGVTSCYPDGDPAYPVIIRTVPHHFNSSRPEA